MNDPLPLWLGIPLAASMVALTLMLVALALVMWSDWRNR